MDNLAHLIANKESGKENCIFSYYNVTSCSYGFSSFFSLCITTTKHVKPWRKNIIYERFINTIFYYYIKDINFNGFYFVEVGGGL